MDDYAYYRRNATASVGADASSAVDWPPGEGGSELAALKTASRGQNEEVERGQDALENAESDGKSKRKSAKSKKDSKTSKGQNKGSLLPFIKDSANRVRGLFSDTGPKDDFEEAEKVMERERLRREAEIEEARSLAAIQKEFTDRLIEEERTRLSLIEYEEKRRIRIAEETRRLELEKELEMEKKNKERDEERQQEMNRRLAEEKAKLQKLADEKARQIEEQKAIDMKLVEEKHKSQSKLLQEVRAVDALRRKDLYDLATARLKALSVEQKENMEMSKKLELQKFEQAQALNQKRELMFLGVCISLAVVAVALAHADFDVRYICGLVIVGVAVVAYLITGRLTVSFAVATVIMSTMTVYGIINWLAGGTAVAVAAALVILFRYVQKRISDAATIHPTQ